MKWYSIFEDATGKLSSIRVAFLVVVFMTMFNWTFISIKKGEMIPLDTNLVTFIVGLGGVKAVQRFGEKGNITEVVLGETTTTTSTTPVLLAVKPK